MGETDFKRSIAKSMSPSAFPIYYWDKKRNFGDLIAPWLVTMMTGRQTFNVKGRSREVALASVGSIITMFDRPGLHVWGSGLMRSLTKEDLVRLEANRPARIHAVRGWRTYNELTSKLGWRVPKIYGDPGLLLPRFFSAQSPTQRFELTLCPHYSHKRWFASSIGEQIEIIDVENDPDTVVRTIANSGACISTSLHGLIVAHAYGVPWVWLEIEGQKLSGTNFKFEDFFTVLDRSSVAHAKLPVDQLTAENLLALRKLARLPSSKFDFDDLLNAFPLEEFAPAT